VSKDKKHTDHTLEVSSKTEHLGEVRTFIAQAAREFGFTDAVISDIQLAVDEACTNIIKHAYRSHPEGIIRIDVAIANARSTPSKFIVKIFDQGNSFDPTKHPAPDMKEYFRKMTRGGLGIVLMRKLMDEVEYAQLPGNLNAITLVKYLPRGNRLPA
jgi:serine/threonine-protein kinase RsbW